MSTDNTAADPLVSKSKLSCLTYRSARASRVLRRLADRGDIRGDAWCLMKGAGSRILDALEWLLITIRTFVAGLGVAARTFGGWWSRAPGERRSAMAFAGLLGLAAVSYVPYGLPAAGLAATAGMLAAGRRALGPRGRRTRGPGQQLEALYAGLVPYFESKRDRHQLYTPEGQYKRAFDRWRFDSDHRLSELVLRYSPYFRDAEPEVRRKVEQVICTRAGTEREYLFTWRSQDHRLVVQALPPLPGDLPAQVFAPYLPEDVYVLGVTDAKSSDLRVSTMFADGLQRPLSVIGWPTGPRTKIPHGLVIGTTGGGKSTFLRHVGMQALAAGHELLILDFKANGDFECFRGLEGVLDVVDDPQGLEMALDWLGRETNDRNRAIGAAKKARVVLPRYKQLLVIFDEITEALEVMRNLEDKLGSPLRLGRAVRIAILAAGQYTRADVLSIPLKNQMQLRVGLGAITSKEAPIIFDAPLNTGAAALPKGRGYVRLGDGPIHRLQVPYVPDPLDDDTFREDRGHVLSLLPGRGTKPGIVTGTGAVTEQHQDEDETALAGLDRLDKQPPLAARSPVILPPRRASALDRLHKQQ